MNHVDPSKSSSTSPPRKPIRRFQGLVGLPAEPTHNPVVKSTIKGDVIDEDKLRQQLGVVKSAPKIKLPDSYRQLLNLDSQDLVEFFDKVIDHRDEFTQVDFVVPSSVLEHRIERLKRVIAASKAVIEGMASNIIKIRRGKDDPLLDDKAARETYKRHERKRWGRCNAKLFLYREALRTGKELHQKVWRTVTKPVYFRDVVRDGVDVVAVLDYGYIDKEEVRTGGLVTHQRTALVDFVRHDYFDLDRYKTIMKLNEESLWELGESESEQKQTWRNTQHWENAIIVAAVVHGVITPRRDLAELLGLGAVLDEYDDVFVGNDEENMLARKTGGAVYGGGIKGEGFTSRGRMRKLTSFDKPSHKWKDGRKDGDGEYHDTGSQSLRDLSDDAESYEAR